MVKKERDIKMSFRVIVCAKQVPDTNEIKIDPVTKTLIREGVPSILNHDDANALEEALRIKDRYPDTHITVLTMGPPQARYMLKQCMAIGADEAVLVSDRALGGSDTWATSNALAAAIRKIGTFDLIFAGRQAIDGDTAQVGPQLAEKLELAQVTYVREFSLEEGRESIVVTRALEDGYERIRIQRPCLLTAIKELNDPRHMSIKGIVGLRTKQIHTWSAGDIEVDLKIVGLEASPTNVYRSFTPRPKGKGMMIRAQNHGEAVRELLGQLKTKCAL